MCLAIPGKIKKIKGTSALFNYNDKEYIADISLSPEVKVGDWILMHNCRALSKITASEAKENLELIKLQEKKRFSLNVFLVEDC